MRVEVTNFGQSDHFPTCDGNVFLSGNGTRVIDISARALGELKKFRFIKVERIIDEPKAEKPLAGIMPTAPDLENMTLPSLKTLAKSMGIKGADGMRKHELREKIKEY